MSASASQRQISGEDAAGSPILSVLVKRAYRLSVNKGVQSASAATLVDPQGAPLHEAQLYADDATEELLHESDLFAYKPATDVVVAGAAHPPRGTKRFLARVAVGGVEKQIAVVGRRVVRGAAFSEPEEAGATPLSYKLAFGGEDAIELARSGHPLAGLERELSERPEMFEENPYAYPRNPTGTGFTIRGLDDGAELPRIEDPDDLLTPERRIAGEAFDWSGMPMPAGLGWFGHLWFPRCVFFGFVPEVDRPAQAKEVVRGLVPLEMIAEGAHFRRPDPRFACAASPGLAVPHLRGGETIALENLSRGHARLEITLPTERPTLRCDGRKGRMVETEPVIHSVLVEPDEERVTLVWRGSAPALRRYRPEELEKMPFEVLS